MNIKRVFENPEAYKQKILSKKRQQWEWIKINMPELAVILLDDAHKDLELKLISLTDKHGKDLF